MDCQHLKLSRDATFGCVVSARGGADEERAARSFYEGVLGGRQVWPTGPRAVPRTLWFLVGSTLVPVSLLPTADVFELFVDSPAAVAERCWDAGYSVRFRAEVTDDLILIDPFGRQILLTSTGAATAATAARVSAEMKWRSRGRAWGSGGADDE